MSKQKSSELQKPEVEMLPLEALIPYACNARTHSDEQVAQVAASIREFGFTNPVLVSAENDIIAGHGRVMAARKLGLEKVPCIRLAHLTETQRRAYVLADNKLALNSGWDEEMLANELQGLRGAEFDLSMLGFDAEAIESALTGGDTDTFTGKGKTPVEKLDNYLNAATKTLSLPFDSETFDSVVFRFEKIKTEQNFETFSEVVLFLLQAS